MGVVYEALDRERNVHVALKTLRSMNADAILRFKNEFRDFQDLQHPNLVSIGELFSEAGEWFFSMELIDGVGFISYVRPTAFSSVPTSWDNTRPKIDPSPWAATAPLISPPVSSQALRGELNEARLRLALRQLALGLCALHEAGKVHRDIKPSNVMVSGQGRVVLLDFGLAADLMRKDHGADVDIVGTVEYMAPEQAAARPVGPEADWYSVGVMLHEALTGLVPLAGPPMEVLMAKQRMDGASARALNPAAPADLDKLCFDLLRFHPGERPTGRQVLARLGQVEAISVGSASMSSFSTGSHFVGRERELQALRECYDRSRKGAQLVAIHGESGVGKSSLVRRFTEQLVAREPDAVVLAGTCYERENVPFKGVDGVIDALSAFLRRRPKTEAAAVLPRRANMLTQVFPVLLRVEAIAEAPRTSLPLLDPRELRNQLFSSLRELLARIADRHPLVLVIDDLQWADADSLALLADLVRPPDSPSILLVATVRGDVSSLPGELPDLQWMALDRMSPSEAHDLAVVLLKRASAQTLLNPHLIAQEAGGHPLFIDELIRHACSVGVTAQTPLALEDALWARVSQLASETREVLELVCLASGRLVQQTAANAAHLGFGDFAKHVAQLRVAHLLRTTGMRATDFVEPYHGRVRTAVTEHLPMAETRAHHRRLALALETSGHPDPEALSVHWREVGDAERAAHFAAIAADKAARAFAFDRAVRFYQLCLELSPEPPAWLRVRLAEALANAGRGGESGRAFLAAAERAPASDALELRRCAAEQLLRSGHLDEGLQAIQAVLEAVGMKLPGSPRAALMSLVLRRARVRTRGLGYKERDESQLPQKALSLIDICSAVSAGLAVVDTIRGADFQARQLLLALEAGEPRRVVRALAMETAYVAIGGTKTRRRTDKLLEHARQVANRLNEPQGTGLTIWASGMASFLGGRWSEAQEQFAQAERIFREKCTGVAWELDTARFISLWSSFYRGDVIDLERRAPALQRESESRGDLYAVTNFRTAFMPFLHLVAGHPQAARREAEEALARWSRQGFHIQHVNGILAGVQADLYEGEGARARATLLTEWPRMERSLLLSVQQIRVRAIHLRGCAAIATGDAARAERDAHKLDGEKAPWAAALADALRAGVRATSGDARMASEAYAHAANKLTVSDMALYAAACRYRAVELVGGDANEVETWMRARKIREPAKMARLLAT
jgi:serine/threonine protein kinase/tetratricopeptide (TPR) repeat protein